VDARSEPKASEAHEARAPEGSQSLVSSGSMPDETTPPPIHEEPEHALASAPTEPAAPSSNEALLDRLRALTADRDRALAAALDGATILEQTATTLRLGAPQAFAAHRLERRKSDLEAVCARLFGHPLRIEIVGPQEPQRANGAAPDDEAGRRRRRDALSNPAVNAALEILGGQVVEIKPLGPG
jgi:hypothetical protein